MTFLLCFASVPFLDLPCCPPHRWPRPTIDRRLPNDQHPKSLLHHSVHFANIPRAFLSDINFPPAEIQPLIRLSFTQPENRIVFPEPPNHPFSSHRFILFCRRFYSHTFPSARRHRFSLCCIYRLPRLLVCVQIVYLSVQTIFFPSRNFVQKVWK